MTGSNVEEVVETVNNLPEPKVRRLLVEHFNSIGMSMPFRHTHLQYEILFVNKGSVSIENNGTRIDLTAPCIIVHKPFTLHRAIVPADQEYDRFVANFDESLLRLFRDWIPELHKITDSAASVIALDDDIALKITDIMNEICECCEKDYDTRSELLLAYLINVITSYVGSSNTYTKQIECAYVAAAMDYIGNHFGENILIDELAKNLFVSRAKFISDFKNYTGITVKQYIQLTRINYAKLMLVSGSSITETAQRCGFCDDSHFVYTFRKLVGMTPRAYSLNPSLADG